MPDAEKKKFVPKGVKKGGARYPRSTLAVTLPWVTKLVSKTHLGPQAKDVILSGVVGAKASRGEIRLSTMKQFGFLNGDSSAYTASDLARRIASAPAEELLPLYAEAAMRPSIFKSLFDTFHGDEITKAKLKQRAFDLGVHPEETETCVDIYASSFVTAGLVTLDGDKVTHQQAGVVPSMPAPSDSVESLTPDEALAEGDDDPADVEGFEPESGGHKRQKAAINVSITLDASLDSDKLEKQLRLLRKYGAI